MYEWKIYYVLHVYVSSIYINQWHKILFLLSKFLLVGKFVAIKPLEKTKPDHDSSLNLFDP